MHYPTDPIDLIWIWGINDTNPTKVILISGN